MKKIRNIFLLTMLFALGMCTHSFARITTNDPTVKSGETVTITISSQEPVASGAINITSNSGLTFKSASGGTTNGTLLAFSKSNNVTSGIATYTFTAPTVTEDKVFKLVFASQDMADENGNSIASSNATATVTVKGTSNGSNENNNSSGGNGSSGGSSEPTKGTLSTFKINGITVKEYLTVTNKDTASIYVKTSTGESATIYNSLTKKTDTIENNKTKSIQIAEGTNTLTITLASGNKYTRKIYSQKEEEVKPNVIEEPKQEEVKLILKSLAISGLKEEEKIDFELTPEFSSEVYEYELTIPEEHNDITKLDIEAIGDKEEFNVEVNGNEELVDGENIITILVKSKDGDKTATYQIKVNKEQKTIEAVTEPVLDDTPNTGEDQNIKLIISIAAIVVGLAAIIFAIIQYIYGKKKHSAEERDFGFTNIYYDKEDIEKEEALEEQKEDEGEKLKEGKPKRRGKHF